MKQDTNTPFDEVSEFETYLAANYNTATTSYPGYYISNKCTYPLLTYEQIKSEFEKLNTMKKELTSLSELISVKIAPDEYAIKEKYIHEKGFSDRFADTYKEENAKLIVEAVNSYDSLIEENKQLKLELDSWKKENFDNVEMAAETIKDLQSVNKMLLEALKDITESYKYCVKKADQSEWFIKANFAINKAESK